MVTDTSIGGPFLARGIALLAVVAGCVPLQRQQLRFDSRVTSLAREDASMKTRYLLLPGEKGVEPTDLQFLEYARCAQRVLDSDGFTRVTAFEDADVVVFLSYGIGNPQDHVYSYSLPMFGQTGVSSSYTSGTAANYGGMTNYSGTTTYTPTYGVTGYSSHVGTYTTFTRFMWMDAIDVAAYRQTKQVLQVWATTVTSTGTSGDLRLVFPYMAAASKGLLGKDSKRMVEVDLQERDPFVAWVRGDQPSQPGLISKEPKAREPTPSKKPPGSAYP
jgi:hypothetical protein